MGKTVYSIVVPVYNEEESLPLFYKTTVPLFDKLNESYEIIFVNDGSKDKSEEILKDLASKDKRVKVLNFSRNFGQQQAINAGLNYASGDAVIVMDVDLQDPPEVAIQMIEKWKEGYEVVHGKRGKRKGETIFKRMTAFVYYRFLRKITGMDMPRDTGEFKLYDRRAVDEVNAFPEHHRYLRGLSTWIGFKQAFVVFDRPERTVGVTKFTLAKMVKLAEDGIISNSSYPLFLSLKMGLVLAFLSVVTFITFIVLVCCGIALPLLAWLFPTIAIFTSLVLVLNGFSNIYIGRIYDEVKRRPNYIVSNTINIEEESK